MLNVKVTPAYGIMEEHGKQIAYSLNEGSRYNLASLQQTGADMGNAIATGLQTSMDMHSPSRRMWGYGEDIVAGLAGSIHAGGATLKSEAQYVAEQIAEGFKASQNRINQEVNSIMGSLTTQMAQLKGAMLKGMDELMKAPAANGMVFLPGVTNLPKGSTPAASTGTGTGTTAVAPAITTLKDALGETVKTVAGSAVSLLGGITLKATDLDAAKATLQQEKETALLTALKRWRDFTLMEKDPLNDYLVDIKQLMGDASDPVRKTLDKWLTMWNTEGDYLNDYLANAIGMLEKTAPRDQVQDFIEGMGSFLSDTLKGASSVFGYFKMQEENAYAAGNLKEYLGSDSAKIKDQLKSVYQGIQNSVADILGVSTSQLNVTGTDSKRLQDRIRELLTGANGGTNVDFIGKLMQSAVDFRNFANFGTKGNYFDSVLPSDARLTGSSTQNTTNYNITLQGSNNANADVLGLIQTLSALQTGAVS